MYNLFEALQNGQSADDIASQFTKELNAAIQKKEEADKAAAKQAALNGQKTKMADQVAAVISDFINDYYPDLRAEDGEPVITGEQVVNLLDSCQELTVSLNKLKMTLFSDDTADTKKTVEDTVEDVFERFFNSYGL